MKHAQHLCISAFCLVIAASILPLQTNAQSATSLPPQQDTIDYNRVGLTLHEIMSIGESRLAADDTSEGGPRAKHHAWNTYWSARAYKNDSSGVNMFDQYAKALNLDAQAKTTQNCGTASGFQGKWRSLGPKSFTRQTLGRVEDIWANPSNLNHMLAATNGGLFKSVNKGQSWSCITDNANLPLSMVTINSVAVHPQNTDIIYLGTANHTDQILGKFGWHLEYGAAILFSTNGGATWNREIIPQQNNWLDTVLRVQHVRFSPDGLRLYAFCGNDIWWRPYTTTGTWQKIVITGALFGDWRDLDFVPGNVNELFCTSWRV